MAYPRASSQDKAASQVIVAAPGTELVFRIEMRMPPGVNRAYNPVRTGTRAKIIKDKTAREWTDYAVSSILARSNGLQCNKFMILIAIPQGNYDIDHFEKETIDALKKADVIPDDKTKYARGLSVIVADNLESGWYRVFIYALPDDYTNPSVDDIGIAIDGNAGQHFT